MRNLIKSNTLEEWLRENPILMDGEVVLEKDHKRFKVGDGKSRYKDLDYVTDPLLGFYFDELVRMKSSLMVSFLYAFIAVLILTFIFPVLKTTAPIYVIGLFGFICVFFYIFTFNKLKK